MFEDLSFRLSLGSDNHSGVHAKVMRALNDANRGHAHAYGMDELCQRTEHEFKRVFGPTAQPEYVFTGTAANVLSLSWLRGFEAVICAESAHLIQDECGAPEKFLGVKLWTIPSADGKIHPEQALPFLQRLGDQHYSQPRVVSLTQPTELGVCYSLTELQAWRRFCDERNLMLHIDGARLANAAAHLGASLREMCEGLADVVSFGGTKNGLMGAEAVILYNESAKREFKFARKQAMQLSSKTRFLAAQFFAYLDQDLWLEIAQHTTALARDLAERLRAFDELRVAFPVDSNAVFVHVPKSWIKPLREHFFFYVWDPNSHLCRWMISWDWTRELNEAVVAQIREVKSCFPAK